MDEFGKAEGAADASDVDELVGPGAGCVGAGSFAGKAARTIANSRINPTNSGVVDFMWSPLKNSYPIERMAPWFFHGGRS